MTQTRYLLDKLELSKVAAEEHQAHFTMASHCTLKGRSSSIDPDRPPKNYQDVLSRVDKHEWFEAYDKEYRRFKEQNAFKVVRPEKGIKEGCTIP
jgi:hypothetical protein